MKQGVIMWVAKKNIDKLLKTIDICIDNKYTEMHTLVCRNYYTNCYAFSSLTRIKQQIRNGYISISNQGIWDTKENNLDFSKSIGNIYDLYRLMRKYASIGLLDDHDIIF